MKGNGIDLRPFFYPLSSQPAYATNPYAREAPQRNITSYRISPYGVNLPCGLNMTEKLVWSVCNKLMQVLGFE
jgi:perosamine synthetase